MEAGVIPRISGMAEAGVSRCRGTSPPASTPVRDARLVITPFWPTVGSVMNFQIT